MLLLPSMSCCSVSLKLLLCCDAAERYHGRTQGVRDEVWAVPGVLFLRLIPRRR